MPIGRHLESFYLRQVRRLREPVQVWLLVAAADSTGNLRLIEAAAGELDLDGRASGDAEQAGLVELGHDARFRHPLVRSAAYNAASGNQRRRVHRALSVVAEKLELTELAAWHAAKATLGADEEVAQRLETVADLAATRGGFTSRARVLTQAAALTPPGPRKHARLVYAAEAALASGTAQLAKTLMDEIDDSLLDPVAHGRLIALGADYSSFTGAPTLTTATRDMLSAAERFHDRDPELEQAALIRAWEWALPAERLVAGVDWQDFGRRLAAGAAVHDGPAATILRGLSALVLLPYDDAIADIRAAVAAYDAMDDAEILRYGHSNIALTTALWDLETRNRTLARWAAAARDTGSLQQLDNALWVLSLVEATSGTPRQAVRYTEQVRELRRAIGWDAEHVINLAALSWNPATRAQVEPLADATLEMGYGGVQSVAHAALAVVEIAEGRYETAYRRLRPFVDDPFFHVTPTTWPDFIEAAARSGHVGDASGVCDALERRAGSSGSPWARGLAARSRALLVDGEHAEAQHRTAIDVLAGTSAVVDHARAHLTYGEWLRRARRRKDARTHLHQAVELLHDTGADPFAERARRELAALGDTSSRQHRDDGGIDLTPQERTVAELAAAGKTNAEIGAAMFLSANTVDYHLRKVYQRLGISSRRQLTDRI